MKSEQRHKREQNDLAYYLEKVINAAAEYQSTILYTLIGIVLLVVVIGVWKSVSYSHYAKTWGEVFASSGKLLYPDVSENIDTVKLSEFGQKNKETSGVVALLISGDRMLQDASESILGNNLTESSQQAKEGLEVLLLAEKNAKGELKTQAQLAVARAYEILASVEKTDENLKLAKEYYNMVAKSGTPLGTVAKDTLAILERPDADKVYVAISQRLANVAERSADVEGSMGLQEITPPSLTDPSFLNQLPPAEGETNLGIPPVSVPGSEVPALDIMDLPPVEAPLNTEKTPETPAVPEVEAPAVTPETPAVPEV
ncbi:MAG: hypothetical protein Q4C96_03925, partial [Planctomycetia bacterium]|nr:hypothetical protein [Planctomycetia bacterium]